MQNVLVAKAVKEPVGLQRAMAAALGEKSIGVSTGPYGMVAHLADAADAGELALAETVLNGHNTLMVSTNKATITADGVDVATVTCADGAIAADGAVNYMVWRNGTLYAEGSDNVVGGTVTLTLTSVVTGTFVIEVRRQGSDYASGYVTVEAA